MVSRGFLSNITSWSGSKMKEIGIINHLQGEECYLIELNNLLLKKWRISCTASLNLDLITQNVFQSNTMLVYRRTQMIF
mgnify:CR=1 FL=1